MWEGFGGNYEEVAEDFLGYALVEYDNFYYIDPDFPKFSNTHVVVVKQKSFQILEVRYETIYKIGRNSAK